MKHLYPKYRFHTLEEIDLIRLSEQGVKAVILDIDNTLVPPHTPVADARAKAFVEALKTKFSVCIVSNNIFERAKKFADSLEADFICDGNKPAKKPFLLALNKLQVSPEKTAVIGDQIFTDVWGANRMGMVAVLVDPICDREGKFVKFKRLLEKPIVRKIKYD